jgi:RNA polymerase sigma-70 factor, ECF subfamily
MSARQTQPTDRSDSLAMSGDAATWLDEHGDALYRYARSRVGNRELAEDLVQDAFLAALQSQDRFEHRAAVRTWLVSILRHKIVDHYRRAAVPVAADEAETDPDSTGRSDAVHDRYFSSKGIWKGAVASWRAPEQALEDREFWDVLEGCLGRLPRSLSSVFVLRELEGLEMSELRRNLALTPPGPAPAPRMSR